MSRGICCWQQMCGRKEKLVLFSMFPSWSIRNHSKIYSATQNRLSIFTLVNSTHNPLNITFTFMLVCLFFIEEFTISSSPVPDSSPLLEISSFNLFLWHFFQCFLLYFFSYSFLIPSCIFKSTLHRQDHPTKLQINTEMQISAALITSTEKKEQIKEVLFMLKY